MTRKRAIPRPVLLTAAELRNRTQRALRESRTLSALDFAKQLHKSEPTSANRVLLRQAYLARAGQLHDQDHEGDAVTVLHTALTIAVNEPTWLEPIAAALARCGAVAEGLEIAVRLGPEATTRVLPFAADSALNRGSGGRCLLPVELREEFDLVVQAFAESEAGNDAGAREALQGIGLRSPFLEWKLLVRGLLAYYGKDDCRVLENWVRLSADRLPSRLAAPLRAAIDPEFRASQSAERQATHRRQFDRLQGSHLDLPLKQLREAFGSERGLAQAFRRAEAVLPALRSEFPRLVDRLASCFYWATIESAPDDLARYQRVFGRPLHDPHFNRLRALAYERVGELKEAHEFWKHYEKELAQSPVLLLGEDAGRARALIWRHMGDNAASMTLPEKGPRLPDFLRDSLDQLPPLKPSAEQCYRRAAELAPESVEVVQALFDFCRDEGKEDEAVSAGHRLLAAFPEHGPTLESLGELLVRRQEYAEAVDLLRRALAVNPLDRELRIKLSAAHLENGFFHAVASRFDPAREEYSAARRARGDVPQPHLLCRWAATEFKADQAGRGEELLAEARAAAGSDLAVAYDMLVETLRQKLPRSFRTRFETEFNAGLAAAPDPGSAARLAGLTAGLAEPRGTAYVGQKTHAKKILAYLDRARGAAFNEDQLLGACGSLILLRVSRLSRLYLRLGRERFPRNPHFPFLEASYMMSSVPPDRVPVWKVRMLLDTAERLAKAAPQEEVVKAMLDQIAERRRTLAAMNPFGDAMMDGVLEELLGGNPFEPPDEGDER